MLLAYIIHVLSPEFSIEGDGLVKKGAYVTDRSRDQGISMPWPHLSIESSSIPPPNTVYSFLKGLYTVIE
jgi:hypothetical protein